MKAISIQQPSAWAILYAGKDFENRSWSHSYRGPILIHAGKKFDHDMYEWIAENFAIDMPRKDEFQMGGVVGMVTITGMLRSPPHYGPWLVGPCGWMLSDPKPLDFISWRGQLGLFDIDIDIEITSGDK